MSDPEEQADELVALASIYSDDVLTFGESTDGDRSEGRRGGTFQAIVDLPDHVISVGSTASSDTQHAVKCLPPITLSFTLPLDYPSVSPPLYTLACSWLSSTQVALLSTELDRLWAETCGMVVLFTWTSFLQSSSFPFLSIPSPLLLPPDTLALVLAHDRERQARLFASSLFTCLVCLRDRQGAQSMKFADCDHVFCRDCMRMYFEAQIGEGAVKRMNCPYEKCQTQACAWQVKDLVSAESFERYDRLLLQLSIDTMSDIVYCPRKDCAYPVEIDRERSMGSCPSCANVFCVYCKRAYHYPSPCAITTGELTALREEYLAASESEKAALEKRYGKRRLQGLMEDGFTNEWMQRNSKQCPSCHAHIQKIDGCNKMACTKCSSYFCWICLAIIPHVNPYSHFNDAQSKCFDKLFQPTNVADEVQGDDDGDIPALIEFEMRWDPPDELEAA